MFLKYGSTAAVVAPTTVDSWNNFKKESNQTNIIASLDKKCVYLHGTILASIDRENGHKFHITPNTEKFINDNGDAFPREEVLSKYNSFKTHAKTYVEHNQGPEHAKGKCVDVVCRNMGDTVLVDVLFTIDNDHPELIKNVKKGYVTHLSMGCQTEYTVCSVCGNIAHNENEYCSHVKTMKRKTIKAKDGKMRKVAELCFNNTWIDISLVMNPAFAGAAIRNILSKDEQGKKVLANIIERNLNFDNNTDYQSYMLKAASKYDVDIQRKNVESPSYTPYHPIVNETSDDEYPPEGFKQVPWEDRWNIKDDFDKHNPTNEAQVEGPINDLLHVSTCFKCSGQNFKFNSKVARCNTCNCITEIEAFKKEAVRKQVLDIVKHIISEVKSKVVPQKILKEYAEGYKFLEKEIKDELSNRGYRLANSKSFSKASQILESYSSSSDLKTASNILESLGYTEISNLLNQAVEKFSDVDESEMLIDSAISKLEKHSNFDKENILKGVQIYIDRVYKKWDKQDISELIYEMFPLEAKYILDEARKLNFR